MSGTTRATLTARGGRAAALRRWLALAAALGLLWITIAVAIPAVQRLPWMAPDVQTLLESGIEVGALFYTGVEKVPEAEAAVHGALSRAP